MVESHRYHKLRQYNVIFTSFLFKLYVFYKLIQYSWLVWFYVDLVRTQSNAVISKISNDGSQVTYNEIYDSKHVTYVIFLAKKNSNQLQNDVVCHFYGRFTSFSRVLYVFSQIIGIISKVSVP